MGFGNFIRLLQNREDVIRQRALECGNFQMQFFPPQQLYIERGHTTMTIVDETRNGQRKKETIRRLGNFEGFPAEELGLRDDRRDGGSRARQWRRDLDRGGG